MRILLVTHFFPPRYNAGTENYTLGLAKSLQARGNEVHVVCAEDWNSGESYWNGVVEEVYQGVQVKRIHLNWTKAGDPNRILYYSEHVNLWMAQLMEKESYDIVHVISAYSLGVGIMESVATARLPLVLTLMDFWFICPNVQLLRVNGELCDGKTTALQCQTCLMGELGSVRKMTRIGISSEVQALLWGPLSQLKILAKQRGFQGRLLNMAERKRMLHDAINLPDVVLTHSNTLREMFALHTEKNIEVLQNGHDLSWLVDTKVKKIASTRLRVGYVGQVVFIKGIHVLIEAFKKAGLGERACLEIWGGLEQDGDYVDHLNKLILSDSSISLRGRFSHDHLMDVFSNIDILVVPSLWYENAPLVIQESFAAQIPVIATNLGGMAESISHEVNGLLFERGDVVDLARQLQRLVDEPRLLDRLKSGIPKVKTVEEEVVGLEMIYKELVFDRNNNRQGEKKANE